MFHYYIQVIATNMSYYGTLNKQLSEYSTDAKKQHRNDLKQMIKYQAYLDTESIDDKLAEKLATLYSDVQGKVSKQKAGVRQLTKPNATVSTQVDKADAKRQLDINKPSFTVSTMMGMPQIIYPKKLKTDNQKAKYQKLVEAGWTINDSALSKTKDVSSFLSNEIDKATRRGLIRSPTTSASLVQ